MKVPRRTPRLATYFQRQLDAERAAVARELHDELGGLLVVAKMDLTHIQRTLGAGHPELSARIAQLQQNLDTIISAKRRLVERLQPGLLVHVGLFAALRWYTEDLAAHTGGVYRTQLPRDEPRWNRSHGSALYRAAQDAIALGEGTSEAPVHIRAVVRAGVLALQITHARALATAAEDDLRLRVILHRVNAAGGELAVDRRAEGTVRLLVTLRRSARERERNAEK